MIYFRFSTLGFTFRRLQQQQHDDEDEDNDDDDDEHVDDDYDDASRDVVPLVIMPVTPSAVKGTVNTIPKYMHSFKFL